MDATVKERWVEALTSGKFTQGSGALRTTWPAMVRHCCLGVLCELYHQATEEGEWDFNSMRKDVFVVRGHAKRSDPHAAVLDWAGLPPQKSNTLAMMNDTGVTFDGIATFIRDEL